VLEFIFVKPGTAVDDCNIADVLFISQIYNVQPELLLNSETKDEDLFVCQHSSKPHVVCSAFC
jgi:hypothetical protein